MAFSPKSPNGALLHHIYTARQGKMARPTLFYRQMPPQIEAMVEIEPARQRLSQADGTQVTVADNSFLATFQRYSYLSPAYSGPPSPSHELDTAPAAEYAAPPKGSAASPKLRLMTPAMLGKV